MPCCFLLPLLRTSSVLALQRSAQKAVYRFAWSLYHRFGSEQCAFCVSRALLHLLLICCLLTSCFIVYGFLGDDDYDDDDDTFRLFFFFVFFFISLLFHRFNDKYDLR